MRHFHEELDTLKQTLLAMGGLVEDQIRRVMRALLERDDALAREVIERDRQVNQYDVEVDEKCVELLALHQPAASDLRQERRQQVRFAHTHRVQPHARLIALPSRNRAKKLGAEAFAVLALPRRLISQPRPGASQ